jgi:hypothetical protein
MDGQTSSSSRGSRGVWGGELTRQAGALGEGSQHAEVGVLQHPL